MKYGCPFKSTNLGMTPEKVYHLDLDSNRGPLWPAGRGRVCIFRAENRRCITASTDLALKPYQTNDLCETGLCGPFNYPKQCTSPGRCIKYTGCLTVSVSTLIAHFSAIVEHNEISF